MATTDPLAPAEARLRAEIARRRTFAIISHPDAGKTTLTEKLLLYGGAIHLAGAVKARRQARHATSDWMALERERGISVTSSVMAFDVGDVRLNLLDTPGHQDFSEDTYRTLVAADSAVMLLDNRKGVEERTRQLFEVCKRRRTPIVTFVNKCDRAGADPLQLLSDVERDLGLVCCPMTWPVQGPTGFAGVADRRRRVVMLFERTEDHGGSRAASTELALDDPALVERIGQASLDQLHDELHLLDEAGHPFDLDAVHDGELSPVYFGSALTNFGVEPFLHDFLGIAPPPTPREATIGPVVPEQEGFSGFVFKIQANMDPKHRDRIAFVRVCSGHFTAGMEVVHVRSGRAMKLAAPQTFLARERTHVEEAWPGDVVGILDRGSLRIGDTLAEDRRITFGGIPRFAPEQFARVLPADPLRRKQLDNGLVELSDEGAAQVFYADAGSGSAPILGAVGRLQFDVMLHRLEHEYNAPCRLEPMSYGHPRWVTGPMADIDRAGSQRGRLKVFDAKGAPVLLFEDGWSLRSAMENAKTLTFHEVAP
ncbi:MAG: peptide chain release factor 3 [Gemmatimonadales bacterium]|nr:peptide chain release factor 3 [Gemmatimonadales bacterium]